MILSMFDVASPTAVVGSMFLIYVAAILMIGAIVTAVIFSIKAAKSKNKQTDSTPENNVYAEAPTSAPQTDEPTD